MSEPRTKRRIRKRRKERRQEKEKKWKKGRMSATRGSSLAERRKNKADKGQDDVWQTGMDGMAR